MLKKVLSILLASVMVAAMGGWASKRPLRVVIGSSSTSGDSYLIADCITRYLTAELGIKGKVDAIGAAEMFETIRTDKGDGKTIAIFHDMTYLGTLFGTYGEEYALETMKVGPRAAQNPSCCFAASADAPYNTLKEAADYAKANPDVTLRVACENGSVSTLCYLAFYQWVEATYGKEVADQFRVIASGVTSEKRQMLWDGNVDIIFDDYFGIQQYVGIDDKQLAMKCVGLLSSVEGAKDAPTYAEQGITFNGEPVDISKDFLFYFPAKMKDEQIEEINQAMAKIIENPDFQADMAKMNYRGAYLPTEEANEFIYGKRAEMAKLIEVCPSFDYLTASKK